MKDFLTKKKNVILIAVIFVILAAVYNLVLFLVADESVRTDAFWTAYAFLLVAFLGIIGSFIYVAADIKGSKLSVSFVNVFVSLIYFAVEFIISVVVMAIKTDNYIPALVVQIILFAAYLIVFIVFAIAKNYDAEHYRENDEAVGYIKKLSAILNVCYNAEKDYDTKETIRKLYDLCRTSAPSLNADVAELEDAILQEAEKLKNMVLSGDEEQISQQVDNIANLMAARNSQL